MVSFRGSRAPVVVVAGHVTHDRRGGADDVVAGGPAYYAARTYRELGATVRLVSAVGADFACGDELADIPAEIRRGVATTELTRDTRPRLVARAEPVLAVDLPEAWRRCDLLHLAPTLSEVDVARWTQVTQARRVAIGVHGWTHAPAPGGAIATRAWSVDRRTLAAVDIACVAEADLAGQADPLDRLIDAVPIVAVTRGALGSDLYVNGRPCRIGVYATQAVDVTGAGETFAAALAYGLLRECGPIEAAQLAAAAASIAIEGPGARCLARIDEAWERSTRVPVDRRDARAVVPLLSLAP